MPFSRAKCLDALHKLGQVGGQLFLWQGHFGPGGHMHDAVAVAQVVQDMGHMLILRAGEDIHMHALRPR